MGLTRVLLSTLAASSFRLPSVPTNVCRMMTSGLEVILELWLVLSTSTQVSWLEYSGDAATQLYNEVRFCGGGYLVQSTGGICKLLRAWQLTGRLMPPSHPVPQSDIALLGHRLSESVGGSSEDRNLT